MLGLLTSLGPVSGTGQRPLTLTNPYPLTFHVSFLSTFQLIGIITRFIIQISAATDKTSQRLTRCLHPASPSIPSSTTPSLSLNSKVSQRHCSFRPGPCHGLHQRTRAGSKSRTCSCCCSALLLLGGGLHSGLVGLQYLPRATREPLVPRERLYAIALLCTRNSSPYTFTFTSNHPPLVSSHLLSSTSTTGPANHAIHLADTLTHTAVALLPIAYSSFHPPHNPPPCHNPPFRLVLSASPPRPLSTRTCLKSLPVPLANLTLRPAAMSPARPLTSRPLP